MSLVEEIEYSEHVSRITNVTFGILSPQTIMEQSVCEVYNHNIVPTPEPGGLLDPRMGPIDRNGENALSKLDLAHDPGNFGHINLAKPVILLQYFQQIVDTLNCICVKCSSILLDKTNPNFDKPLQKLSGKNRFLKVSELTKSVKNCYNCGACKVIFKKDKEGIGKISARGEVMRIPNDMDACLKAAEKESTSDNELQKNEPFQFVDPEVCLAILKNITDDDCRLMGYVPEHTRPDSMIWGSVMPVPPPCMRPPVQSDGQINDDDLTHKLNDIVKTNNLIRNLLDSKEKQQASNNLDIIADEGEASEKSGEASKVLRDKNTHIAQWWQLLQYHIATYIDNSSAAIPTSTSRSGRPYKTLRARVKAKEGRIRGNLMGKRVNFSARSVITPDPNISIDQVGVPVDIATNLTFPEYVNESNIETLTRLVMNGDKWPGAKSVKYNSISPIETPVGKCNQNFKCRLSYLTDDQRNKIKLSYGDVVERHMMDGDIVLFNRQPSLHKMSMMGHRAKVMKRGSSFRLNISATTPYNADFDGDEMNLHFPRTPESQFEVGEICGLPYQIVSPQASKPVMGLVQDSLMASYLFPKLDHNLNIMEYMFLLGWTNTYQPYGKLSPPLNPTSISTTAKVGDEIVNLEHPIWKPIDVFSTFIPKLSYMKETENYKLVIKDGTMEEGRFDKSSLGAKAGSLIHNVWMDFGPEPTRNLFDNLMNIATQWLLINGFSVGLSDMLISTNPKKRIEGTKEVKDHVRYRLEEAKLKTDYLHRGDYPINTPLSQKKFLNELIALIGDLTEEEEKSVRDGVVFLDLAKPPYVQFERDISDVLEKARSSAEKITYNYVNEPLPPGPDGQARVGNRMNVMVDSGSKGSKINLVQIISLLGQQVIEGGRITTGGFRGRILPHFYKGNITPEASGFIQNGYLKGLNGVEYWFHAMAARIGLISTSIKTAETGYLQRRLIKAMEDLHIAYDNTVRNANDVIVQYSYGYDSFDGSRIEPVKFDYLDMSDTQFQITYEYTKTDAEFKLLLSPSAHELLKNTPNWGAFLDKEFQKHAEDRYILKNHVYRNGVPSKIYSPINFNRVIETILYRYNLKNTELADVNPVYIITEVNKFLEEIVDLYAPIDGNTEKGEKTLAVVIAIFRNHLASKKLLRKKLNKLAFDYLLEQCRVYFYKAIIAPGENVGVIAAQSIGEPSTQMTLDVFHSTGVGSKANVSRGVPRINEILRVAPNLKTPSLTVHINQTYLRYPDDDREVAYKRAKQLGSSLEYTVLSKLIEKAEIIYDIHSCTYEKDNAMIQTYYEFLDLKDDPKGKSEAAKESYPIVLRIKFDENILNEKNITMYDIRRAVEEYDEGKKFVLIFSDDNSEELICRISVKKETTLNPITDLKNLEQELKKIQVKGIADIDSTTVRLIDPYYYNEEDGTIGKSYNYVIDTEGVNLIDVLAVNNVEYTKTTSNHILEVLEVLGVEAARATIIQEITDTIESADAYVNPRHIELLADVMTIQGNITSVDRHGSHKTDSGPLSKASFEETTLQLFNASIYSEEDPMTGVSANIMFGQCIQTGTNAFDVLFDAETALTQ